MGDRHYWSDPSRSSTTGSGTKRHRSSSLLLRHPFISNYSRKSRAQLSNFSKEPVETFSFFLFPFLSFFFLPLKDSPFVFTSRATFHPLFIGQFSRFCHLLYGERDLAQHCRPLLPTTFPHAKAITNELLGYIDDDTMEVEGGGGGGQSQIHPPS